MTPHKRRYWRQVNLSVFAPSRAVDDIGRRICVQSRAALRANIWAMIDSFVRRIMQSAAMALMPRLGSARLGLFSSRLSVR